MVKSAGFLKKLKKVGNIIGKGVSWVNKNIVKPLNPIIDTALDFIPYGNVAKGIKNTISNGIESLGNKLYNTKNNNTIQNLVRTGADVLLDTQRSNQDRKYFSGNSDDDDDDDYDFSYNSEAPVKTFSNPFGKRLN